LNLTSGVDAYLSSGVLPFYYSLVVIINLALIIKFKWNKFAVFIILLFSEGLFVYLGNHISIFNSFYKIGFFAIAILLFHKPLILLKKRGNEKWMLTVILLIGIFFFISGYLNHTNPLISLSQFSKKYFILVLFYFGLRKVNDPYLFYIGKIFIWVLVTQVLFTLIKLILFGFGESLIGSISFDGGGPSNILPVLGFLIIFLYRKGKLSKKDWCLIFGLFLIAVIGNKRSVIVILPLIIGATLFYVHKSISLFKLIKFLPLIFFLLYLGVRINPTLNPEGTRWGSFDLGFLQEYSINYTFGNEEAYESDDLIGGRGGSFVSFLKNDIELKDGKFLFGEGINSILLDYENFENERFGIDSKGSAGAALQNFIAYGFIGVILIFLFTISWIRLVSNYALSVILLFFLIWDYILFYNTTITINAMGISLIFIVELSNRIYKKPCQAISFNKYAIVSTKNF